MTDTQKNELLEQFRDVESQLSPEWLTCDGELSTSQVRRKARVLHQERAVLIKKLGYEPTTEELYPNLTKFHHL
jgi:hypothetical protein